MEELKIQSDAPAGPAPKKSNRRRVNLVKKEFQLKAFFFIFLITLCAISLHSFFLVHLMASSAKAGTGSGLTMRIIIQDFCITMVILVVLDYVMGILGTHLVAGPIYKFQQFMRRMARGDLSGEVYLRKGDALKDVARDMNETLTGLRALVERDRVLLQEVREDLGTALSDHIELEPILAKMDHITAAYRLTDEEPIPAPEEIRLTPWV